MPPTTKIPVFATEMAKECRDVIGSINLVKNGHLDGWTINHLDNAISHVDHVAVFLCKLEKRYNGISTQLRPLFQEASDSFLMIHSHVKHQGRTSDTIAERLEVSKASRSTSQMISEVLHKIKLENIADRVKASKPSTPLSSPITMEMVWFVESLLGCTESCLYRVKRSVRRRPPAFVLKKKLQNLRVFITLTAKWCIEHASMKDLFNLAGDVAYSAAHLCVFGLAYCMDFEFSELLERICPFRPEVRQIYKSLLIASKSSRSDTTMNAEHMLDFVSALEDDLEELLLCGGRIPRLQQGLSYLSRFLQDIELKRTPPEEFNFAHTEALAIEAAVVIYSYYDMRKWT